MPIHVSKALKGFDEPDRPYEQAGDQVHCSQMLGPV